VLEEATLTQLGEILPWVQYTPDKILNADYRVLRLRMPYSRKLPRQPMSQVVKEWTWKKHAPSVEQCQPSLLQWVKKWYHLDPPPASSHLFLQRQITAIGGTLQAGNTILCGQTTTVDNLFTVPRDYIAYVRSLQVLLEDADYESLFVQILHNGFRAHDLQSNPTDIFYKVGAMDVPGTATFAPLPLFPQGFHNILVAFDEGSRIGVSVFNNHIAERIVWVGLWGWKVRKTCLDDFLKR